MNIGSYCRNYRVSKNVTLSELCHNHKEQSKTIKSLSAFEHGRSSNYKFLSFYVKLSIKLDDGDFAHGLMEVLNGY